MYNKEKILELINQDGLFIDKFIMEAFIKNWKIDPIYEDENGVEYFDEMTIEKIKNGISQKNQSRCEIHIMDKDDGKPVEMSVEVPIEVPIDEPAQSFENTLSQSEEEENVPVDLPMEIAQEAQNDVQYEIQNEVQNEVLKGVESELQTQLQNITVDVSNQTLAVLAESIARKITADVSEFLKKSDFIEEAVHMGELKKDNEILVEKIEELLGDNKILVQRIRELEDENDSYVKIFGNIYVKNSSI